MVTNDDILVKIEELINGQKKLDNRQENLEKEMKRTKKFLSKRIKDSQEDTIDAISEMINFGYNMHEERINRLEDHLHLPPIKQ